MSARDPRSPGMDVLAAKRGALPFLPTLVTAVAVAALSLLCRQPGTPQAPSSAPWPAPSPAASGIASVAVAARAGSDGFHPAAEAAASEALPAALAFARHRPLALQAMTEEARPAPRASLPARAAAARRACPAGARCGEVRRTETARNTPTAAPRPAPEATTGALAPRPRPEEGGEEALPPDALPFVPVSLPVALPASLPDALPDWADGLRRLGRGVADETASLGGAVKDLSLAAVPLPAALPALERLAGLR